MDLSPVVLRDENNVTIDDDYSRKIAFRNRHQSLQAIMDDDGDYMHFEFANEPAELNGLNFLNAMTMMLHVFVSLGIGMWGLDGLMSTHWQVTQDYETLVTPAKWTYYVWIPILVFETVFTIAQLLPSFRSRPMIQDGTGYGFFYVCLLQTAWVLCFSFQQFIASFILVVLAFFALTSLLIRQHFCQTQRQKSVYWLFRFPFFLHCGWMAVMVVVNFSMLIRNETSNIGTQLATDVVGLAVLLPLATFLLWSGIHLATDFCIPSVIIWCYVSSWSVCCRYLLLFGRCLLPIGTVTSTLAYVLTRLPPFHRSTQIGIAWRLRHPSDVLLNDCGETIIDAVQLTSYIMASIVAVLLIPRMIISAGHRFLTIQVVTMQEDSLTLE